jgi:hypothetical protein
VAWSNQGIIDLQSTLTRQQGLGDLCHKPWRKTSCSRSSFTSRLHADS